jgi:hypothetical protein
MGLSIGENKANMPVHCSAGGRVRVWASGGPQTGPVERPKRPSGWPVAGSRADSATPAACRPVDGPEGTAF